MRRLRLMYAAGPGDVVGTYRHWRAGHDDEYQPALPYSGLFFDVCRHLNAHGTVVSSNARKDRIDDEQFTVMNLPKSRRFGRLGFHWSQIRHTQRILDLAVAQKADALILSDDTGYWFPLLKAPPSLKIIASYHCTPSARGGAGRLRQFLGRRDPQILAERFDAILHVSEEIRSQLDLWCKRPLRNTFGFHPVYRDQRFADIPDPVDGSGFHVLYCGRLEEDKGILDLLQVFSRLHIRRRFDIMLHLCGDGSLQASLPQRIRALQLENQVKLHGHVRGETLQKLITRAHVMIAPTTANFAEGLNKSVIEGVLARRPVIVSDVCPAVDLVPNGIIKIAAGDLAGYEEAILLTADHPEFVAMKQKACADYAPRFYDTENGWGAALRRALQAVGLVARPGGGGGSITRADLPPLAKVGAL